LTREARDATHPGPPSFFTRRRDGIPVPTLGLFMSGYRNLFKLDIPSKTMENSYLIMNRQIWTNQKNLLSRKGEPGGEEIDGLCKLCRERENTMHLMFECTSYSEPLWTLVENLVKETIRTMSNGEIEFNGRFHAYLVMYNISTNVPTKYTRDVMILIQETKRNIIYRRFRRKTNGVGITTFNRLRLLAHLSITVQKICNLRKYQGKTHTFFEIMQKNIRDMLD
jgi:hypothetical protein